MHSSRMCTAHSSGCWGDLPQCMLGYPLWCGPGDTPLGVGLETSQVWAWRPPGMGLETPLGVGLETPLVWTWRPPQARPLNFPLGCWPGDHPWPDPSTSPPGCGPRNLQGMLGYHSPLGDLLQGMLGYYLQ